MGFVVLKFKAFTPQLCIRPSNEISPPSFAKMGVSFMKGSWITKVPLKGCLGSFKDLVASMVRSLPFIVFVSALVIGVLILAAPRTMG